ncbi:hypothetical protein JCM3766R1_001844 [Sporobolomyces carnicolor]
MRSTVSALVLILSALSSAATASPATKSSKVKAAAAEDNPDDPTGKILYITEPACGYYRCTVTWHIGEQVAVNWLGPPGGNVAVSLMSNIGGPTYPITNSIAGTSQEGYCDAGYGVGVVAPGHECGRVEFVVPAGWQKMDNYTIVVQSLDQPDEIGYTDMITIADANSSVSNAPSGSSVSLLTIAAPTSTNSGASQKATISVPSPTAVTGQPSSSAIAPSSSSAMSSSFVSSSRGTRTESSTAESSSSSPNATAASAGSSPSPSSSQTPASTAALDRVVGASTALLAVAIACLTYL